MGSLYSLSPASIACPSMGADSSLNVVRPEVSHFLPLGFQDLFLTNARGSKDSGDDPGHSTSMAFMDFIHSSSCGCAMLHCFLFAGYIITFVLGVPLNVLALSTFCRKVSRKATPIDVLLLNLTISDLIFLAFLPFKMKEAVDGMTWSLPFWLCPFTGFIFYVTIYNSTLLLTAVAVERYLGVAFPLRYSLCRRPRYAVWASAIFWLVTLTNLSIVYIMPSATNDSIPSCYLEFTPKELEIVLPVRLELFLVLFCVPFCICTFCYINFILILSRLPNISRRKRLRAIGLALGTLLVFAVCFGPYNVSHVVGFARKESEEWRHVALLCSTFNACLDPIIFYFSSAAVRGMLKNCFKTIMAKLHILKFQKPANNVVT